jgi:hypothetical protein
MNAACRRLRPGLQAKALAHRDAKALNGLGHAVRRGGGKGGAHEELRLGNGAVGAEPAAAGQEHAVARGRLEDGALNGGDAQLRPARVPGVVEAEPELGRQPKLSRREQLS